LTPLVLGRILHNRDYATKKTLLQESYKALRPDDALIIQERLIDDNGRVNAAALLASLNMQGDYTGRMLTLGRDVTGFVVCT
jgi:O-methyltransferase domain